MKTELILKIIAELVKLTEHCHFVNECTFTWDYLLKVSGNPFNTFQQQVCLKK